MKIRHELNSCLYSQKTEESRNYEIFNESLLYAKVSSGDLASVRQMLKSGALILDKDTLSQNQVRNTMYHFVLASSALEKACIESGMGRDEAHAISNIYIQKADACKSCDTICQRYKDLCLDFTERMCEIRKEPVISLHIRKCIDYIYAHLGSDLSVKALAAIINLNPTYLARLFLKETGVPIKQFVTRAKIDTAQNLLKYSDIVYSELSV